MSKTMPLSLVCALLFASPAIAQTSRPTSRPVSKKEARKMQRKKKRDKGRIVAPADAEENSVRLLKDIIWYSDLQEAKELAKKQKKLVFWMHAVGNLPGKI